MAQPDPQPADDTIAATERLVNDNARLLLAAGMAYKVLRKIVFTETADRQLADLALDVLSLALGGRVPPDVRAAGQEPS